MKKAFFAVLAFLAAGMIFAAEYKVKYVFGNVNYETPQKKWAAVVLDQKITDETVLNIGVNSTIIIVGEEGEITFKAMQKGTVAELIKANSASGITGIKMSPSSTAIKSVEAENETTGKGTASASSRQTLALEDMEMDE